MSETRSCTKSNSKLLNKGQLEDTRGRENMIRIGSNSRDGSDNIEEIRCRIDAVNVGWLATKHEQILVPCIGGKGIMHSRTHTVGPFDKHGLWRRRIFRSIKRSQVKVMDWVEERKRHGAGGWRYRVDVAWRLWRLRLQDHDGNKKDTQSTAKDKNQNGVLAVQNFLARHIGVKL